MKATLKQFSFCTLIGSAIALAVLPSAIAQSNAPQGTVPAASAAAKAKPVDASSKAGTSSTTHGTVEYKDPEDMTTRYRPGNNKTTRTSADSNTGLPANAPTGSPAAAPDEKKHVANVKYQDRQATVPALDGASKDAAKSKVAPPTASPSDKKAPPAAQDASRANKVDSFTVKQ